MSEKSLEALLCEAETFFEQLDSRKAASSEFINIIYGKVDRMLYTHNYNDIPEILSLYENADINETSETHKIYNICQFAQKELALCPSLCFLSDVSSTDELIDKYCRCIYAFQRINLSLEESHAYSAIEYLCSVILSPYALFGIISTEYIEDLDCLLNEILNIMSDQWSLDLICSYRELLVTFFPTENNLLNFASFLIDHQSYSSALDVLKRISSPNNVSLQLISMLEGLLNE